MGGMDTRIYQVGTPDGREQLAIGRDNEVLATFTRGGLMDRIRGIVLQGTFQEAAYALMMPAPWNGSKWRLLEHGRDMATAENFRVGALNNANFEVNYFGRALRLEATDRHGHEFRLSQDGRECGGLKPRTFERGAPWYADFEAPQDLPVPVVAFLGWLTREGARELRRRMR